MTWLKSFQTLSKHKKTLATAGRLSVDRHTVIGHLMDLWWWGLDNVPSTGFMGNITDFEIALAADWHGDATEFVNTLIDVGFIDENIDGRWLHDWYDYAGKLLEKREEEKNRSKERRSTTKKPTSNQRSTNGRNDDNQQTTDGKSKSNKKIKDIDPQHDYTDEFESFWSVYPRHVAKKDAHKVWMARIKGKDATPDDMIRAAENYAKECAKEHREEKYIKHPATFLGPSRFYEDYIRQSDKVEPKNEDENLSPEELADRESLRRRLQLAYDVQSIRTNN